MPPLPPLPFVDGKEAPPTARRPVISFARAISWGIRVYAEPDFNAKVVEPTDFSTPSLPGLGLVPPLPQGGPGLPGR